jgi:hypothetical protein
MHTFNVHKGANVLKIFLISLLLNACGTTQKEEAYTDQHIDLPGFFQDEISKLHEKQSILVKPVSVEGSSETRRIPLPDWKSELSAFTEIDLNSKSYRTLFKVDTIYAGSHITLQYTSREPASKLKKCLIRMNHGTPDSIVFLFHSVSLYGLEEKTLVFRSNKDYSVSVVSDPAVGKSSTVEIKGTIAGN